MSNYIMIAGELLNLNRANKIRPMDLSVAKVGFLYLIGIEWNAAEIAGGEGQSISAYRFDDLAERNRVMSAIGLLILDGVQNVDRSFEAEVIDIHTDAKGSLRIDLDPWGVVKAEKSDDDNFKVKGAPRQPRPMRGLPEADEMVPEIVNMPTESPSGDEAEVVTEEGTHDEFMAFFELAASVAGEMTRAPEAWDLQVQETGDNQLQVDAWEARNHTSDNGVEPDFNGYGSRSIAERLWTDICVYGGSEVEDFDELADMANELGIRNMAIMGGKLRKASSLLMGVVEETKGLRNKAKISDLAETIYTGMKNGPETFEFYAEMAKIFRMVDSAKPNRRKKNYKEVKSLLDEVKSILNEIRPVSDVIISAAE